MGHVEDRDPVRGHTEIVKASIGERHPFIDPEDADSLRILRVGWTMLNDDCNILHLGGNPGREIVQNGLHHLLKCREIHGLIVPRSRKRPRWKEAGGAFCCEVI